MRIVEQHSHLNGWEYIQFHKPQVWQNIVDAIGLVDADDCRTGGATEPDMADQMPFSPGALNRRFHEELSRRDWHGSWTSHALPSDVLLIPTASSPPLVEQGREIIEAEKTLTASYNEADFVKDRIAVEAQFGKYSFAPFDLLAKHMAFFVGDVIDVGVEVLPMKAMSTQMSSGISYYEGELYNVIRQGRGVPAVPLVLLGVAP